MEIVIILNKYPWKYDVGGVGVFDGQDLKRELTEDDEADFAFLPDGIISKKRPIQENEVKEVGNQEHEDNGDLFE